MSKSSYKSSVSKGTENHTGTHLLDLWYLGIVSFFQWHSNIQNTWKAISYLHQDAHFQKRKNWLADTSGSYERPKTHRLHPPQMHSL